MQMCEQCGKNQANVHVTQISPSGTVMAHLCEECAKNKGIALTLGAEGAPATAVAEPEKTCARCGTTLSLFRQKGRLGCSDCYAAFAAEVDKMLVEVHGTSVHTGKRYSRVGRVRSGANDIKRLRAELDRAVLNEEFEEAARLRDTINSLSAAQ